MIEVRNIKKCFSNQTVLCDFNYQFQSTGFYLLFGPSGCGKTTLLNILAGIWKSDQGQVLYNTKLIEECEEYYQKQISYITQDAYFVDYLSVYDNMKICRQDTSEIDSVFERLNLKGIKEQFPSSLSGGERQRLALARSLLLHRSIILLDEPTSALDALNRDIILQILNDLKHDHLIICVSHDPVMKDYCDEIIDFVNLDTYKESQFIPIETMDEVCVKKEKKITLFPYIKQQFKYYKINKGIAAFIVLLLTSFFLASFMFLDMESKIISSLGSDHHVNAMKVYCATNEAEKCLTWTGKDNVLASVYSYADGGSYFENKEQNIGESVSVDVDYLDSLVSFTLPMQEDLFYYHDHISHGTYIENKQDIILGSTLAEKLSVRYASEEEELIGRSIQIETAHGQEEFQIRGIFKPYSNNENPYLQLTGNESRNANNSYFFSELYAKDYLYDEQLGAMEKNEKPRSTFYFYFNSFKEALEFQENAAKNATFIQVETYVSSFSSVIDEYKNVNVVLLPILFLLLFIMITFHLSIQNIQMKYEKHILSVYQYCGYSMKDIEKATILYYVVEMTILSVIALVCSIGLVFVINSINSIFHMSTFQLFAISEEATILAYICLILFGCVFLHLQFRNVKITGWYNLLRSRRDFL